MEKGRGLGKRMKGRLKGLKPNYDSSFLWQKHYECVFCAHNFNRFPGKTLILKTW